MAINLIFDQDLADYIMDYLILLSRVKAKKDGQQQWEWGPDWNRVDPGWPWRYAFFWSEFYDAAGVNKKN